MHEKSKELMLVAAWHIEKEAASMKEGERFKRAMGIVSDLRRMAGVTEPAEPEPEVVTPIEYVIGWRDPAKVVPEPLHTVLVVWRPLYDEDVLDVDKAYRCPDGKWVLDDDLSYTAIEPLAWTPKPRIPKWVEDKL